MGLYIGIDLVLLIQMFGNLVVLGNVLLQNNNLLYMFFLMFNLGIQIGQYDGCVNYMGQGIVLFILLNLGSNDLLILNIGGVYMVLWNSYLNIQFKYMLILLFVDLNDVVFNNWDFSYIDLMGVNKGGGNMLYIVGDFVLMMSLNFDLKVLQVSGYFDVVMLFYQIELMLV